MSENEAAELFNGELDVLLRDGRPPFPSHDEALIRTAAALAAADFSGESAIREELRARLAGGKERAGVPALVVEVFTGAAFKMVFAAACMLLLVTQVARRPGRAPSPPEPAASLPAPAAPVAALPRALPAPPRVFPASPRPVPVPGDGALFASIPMSAPRGEPLGAFPIGSAGAGSPIVTAAAREVKADGGTDLVMETESVVLIIERRATSYEEFFDKRTI